MKPSWDDAPEGAKYLAQDNDGYWVFYWDRPTWNGVEWYPNGRCAVMRRDVNPEDSLEERPNV